MSDIVGKTIASLPGILGTFDPSGAGGGASYSRTFQTFVKTLGNVKSKFEEEQFIKKELAIQKQRLAMPGITTGQMREFLVRLLYCHMLGHDISFAYIHVVKLAQQGNLLEKQVGYLLASVFLNEGHELVMLLINTIQKDLRSSNVLEVCMALTAANHLISADMIPALLPLVDDKLKHQKEIVRKKAVLCMHGFYERAPDLLTHMKHHLQQALCDRDPGVMWAGLHFYHHLAKINPSELYEMVPTFVELLEQVLGRHLHSDFEYHGLPAPWLQILLLKILAQLGHQESGCSQKMYEVLQQVLQRTDPSHKIGLAVIYECLETILYIWPHPALIEHAAKCVAKFLSSKSNNLKYLGVKALAAVVQIDPGYAVEHQEMVVECLQHPDLTLRIKTLDLLYRMANDKNLQVICEKLLDQLSNSTDVFLRTDIVSKVMDLTQRFAADRCWYIDTINRVLLQTGNTGAPPDVTTRVITLLQKDCGEPDGSRVRQHALNSYWNLLQTQSDIPHALLQIASWVLGSYMQENSNVDGRSVVQHLLSLLSDNTLPLHAKSYIITALCKLSCQWPLQGDAIQSLYSHVSTDSMELTQRLHELEAICSSKSSATIQRCFTNKYSKVGDLDLTMSFLDDYVAEALEHGATPYKPVTIRAANQLNVTETNRLFAGLRVAPYDHPSLSSLTGSSPNTYARNIETNMSFSSGGTPDSSSEIGEGSLKLKGVKKVWSHQGAKKNEKDGHLTEHFDMPIEDTETDSIPVNDKKRDEEEEDVEDVRRKRELASVLFSGVQSPSAKSKVTLPAKSSSKWLEDPSEEVLVVGDSILETKESPTVTSMYSDFMSEDLQKESVLSTSGNDQVETFTMASMYDGQTSSNLEHLEDETSYALRTENDTGEKSLYLGLDTPDKDNCETSYALRTENDTGEKSLSLGLDTPDKDNCADRDLSLGIDLLSADDLMSPSEGIFKELRDSMRMDSLEVTQPNVSSDSPSTLSMNDKQEPLKSDGGALKMGGNENIEMLIEKMPLVDALCVVVYINAVVGHQREQIENAVLKISTSEHLLIQEGEEYSRTTVTVALTHLISPNHCQKVKVNVRLGKVISTGELNLMVEGCGTSLHKTLPLSLTDFLRCAEIDLDSFARLWPSCTHERHCHLSTLKTEEHINGVISYLHLYTVQHTDGEWLMCGEMVGGEMWMAHLDAGQPQDGGITMWIKSQNSHLLDAILQSIQTFNHIQ